MKTILLSAMLMCGISFIGNAVGITEVKGNYTVSEAKGTKPSFARPKDWQTYYIPSFLCVPGMYVIYDDCDTDGAVELISAAVDSMLQQVAGC